RVSVEKNFGPIGSLVLVGISLLYVFFRPALYHFDGYMYQLEAGTFPEWIHPHHLIWLYVEYYLYQIFSWFHWAGNAPYQLFGVFLSAVSLILFFLLLKDVSRHPLFALSAA